jgi:hypothetical protein
VSRREVAESSGFSLHAGIAAKAAQRDKLEHLARYVSRPPVATERLSLTEGGLVRLALKTPYRDSLSENGNLWIGKAVIRIPPRRYSPPNE